MIKNIILVGPMGAGKSTVGTLLAKSLNFDFIDIDKEIERINGVSISWIFDVEGESGFRERESQFIQMLKNYQNCVIATGGGAILREENRKILRKNGFVIYLKTSVEEQLKRVANSKTRPLLQAENLEARLIEMAKVREEFYQAVADKIILTNEDTVFSLNEKLLEICAQEGLKYE